MANPPHTPSERSTPSAHTGARSTSRANTSTMDAERTRRVHQAIRGSAIGNAIEWFDYAIYSYLALYIPVIFYGGSPDESGGIGLVLAYATFAVSFLVRPFGGIILGPLGDRVGRQKVLVLTIGIMTLGTVAIGLLPTFDTIGWWAAGLLVLCRLVQGFATGGEYGGAAVYMAETAPDRRRGFYGSFLELGTLVGTAGGAATVTILITVVGDQGIYDGWWRLPFLLTLPLGLLALWIRTHLHEPDVFAQAREASAATSTTGNDDAARPASRGRATDPSFTGTTTKTPLRDLVRGYTRQILVLMGFVVMLNVANYLILTYMPGYLGRAMDLSTHASNWMLIVVMLGMIAVITPLGHLSDRFGRKPVLLAASLGFMVLSVPAFMMINTHSLVLQWAALIVLGLLLVVLLSSVSSTLPPLFPTAVRYSGFAIGYNIATSLFGGTASTVTEALEQATGSPLIPGFYLAIAGLIGLVSVLCMRETAHASMKGSEIPGHPDTVGIPRVDDMAKNRALAGALESSRQDCPGDSQQ